MPERTVLLFDVGAVHTLHTASSSDSHFVFAAQKDAFEQYLALYFPNMNLFASEAGRKFIKLLLYNVLAQIQIHSSPPTTVADEYVFDIIEKINNLTYLKTPVTSIYKNYPVSSTYLF